MMPSLLWVAFVSGVATSLGPCLVPRYFALAVQIGNGANGISIGTFLGGCVVGYIAFAAGAAIVAVVQASSHVVYAVAAVILGTTGVRTLLLARSTTHRHIQGKSNSLGARFFGGVCCSMFGAPCCMPIALALGIQSSAYDPAFGATTLAAFGAGQALPLGILAAGFRLRLPARVQFPADFPATVGGTLLIAMGALFGAMA